MYTGGWGTTRGGVGQVGGVEREDEGSSKVRDKFNGTTRAVKG